MTKEATTPKKKRTTRKTTKATKPKEENKAAMANTPQPTTPNEDPSHNKTIEVKEEDKPKNNTKEFNLNDYPRYTQTRYNVLLDRYMRQNHLFTEAHTLAIRDLKLQKLI